MLVSLLPLEEPLEVLKALFHGNDVKSKMFKSNIIAYNSVMAFVSLGAQIDEIFSWNGDIHNFQVHGSVYHCIGNLLLDESR